MNKKLLLLITLSATLFSCGDSANTGYIEKYTVIWQNYNGDILEIDRNLTEGTLPTYDGQTPAKPESNGRKFVFEGWDKQISPVTENTTYTAVYSIYINTYTVTWKNYDGTTLEIDEEVPEGTIPTYNGATPKKEGTETTNFIFTGWTPTVAALTEDTTYTARFYEMDKNSSEPGINPTLSDDGKHFEYGFYPQTYVSNQNIINELNTLPINEETGWYFLDGVYYAKQIAQTYNNETYAFSNGTSITNGSTYWFKCETIKWKILSETNGNLLLVSESLLDTSNYYKHYKDRTVDGKTISANNYKESDIRKLLNNEFLNSAFVFDKSYLKEQVVNNQGSTTKDDNNVYACENTNDKVSLLSYKDYLNPNYGFESDSSIKSVTRQAKVTDYARARGAYCSTNYTGAYWTRSPSEEYNYCAWNVNTGGYLSCYGVESNEYCIRPSIIL